MNAASGTFADSSYSRVSTPGNPSSYSAPTDNSDSSSSFEDVMQQQDGAPSQKSGPASSSSTPTQTPAATTATNQSKTGESGGPENDSTPADTPTATDVAPAKASAPTTPTTPTTTVTALIVQARAQAPAPTTGMKDTPALPTTKTSVSASNAKTTTTTSGNSTLISSRLASQAAASQTAATTTTTDDTDLSSMLSRLAALISKTPGATPAATTGKAATSDKTSTTDKTAAAPTATLTPTAATDLSTVIAQAAILASNTQTTPAAQVTTPATQATTYNAAIPSLVSNGTAKTGKDIPLSTSGTAVGTATTKEKKSTTSTTEGSFIQSGTTSTESDENSSSLGITALTSNANASGNKQVTAISGTKNSSSNTSPSNAAGTAGTANVESEKDMSATTNAAQIAALSGIGGNATTTSQTPADVNIVLSSNNDFDDALKHVMQIASINQTSESQIPLRVAIEIQTPPGAIVNVYVSKQDDGYRAQLSTNDPAALSWVQEKMSSLRESDTGLGVSVKWLPPQMEGSTTTVSTGQSNLGWDRNGQNQAQYQQQQQEERPQHQRQRTEQEPALAGIGAHDDFMSTFTSLQEVA
jgi:hypothetical protein